MQRTLMATVFCFSLVPAAQAADVTPGVDIYAGGYGWNAQPSGSFASTDPNFPTDDEVDVEDDLDFGKNRNNIFYVGIEHAVPVLPNIRVRSADISDSATSQLERSFTYKGDLYLVGETVNSRYQLDYTEATLYYSPLETGAKLDVGITARRMDAEFEVESSNGSRRGFVSAEATLPMIHVGLTANLPLTGVYVQGELDGVSYDGNSLTDGRVAAGWRADMGLGIEAGYQQMSLKLDDVDNVDANLDLAGPYLSLSVNF